METTDDRRSLGRRGEDLAEAYLRRKGYEILDRNWRCEQGELDVVARKAGALAFVEVRTRRGQALGTPEESITPAKQARLATLAEAYVQASGWRGFYQIDIIAIEMDRAGRVVRFDHYENAVSG